MQCYTHRLYNRHEKSSLVTVVNGLEARHPTHRRTGMSNPPLAFEVTRHRNQPHQFCGAARQHNRPTLNIRRPGSLQQRSSHQRPGHKGRTLHRLSNTINLTHRLASPFIRHEGCHDIECVLVPISRPLPLPANQPSHPSAHTSLPS